MANKVQGVFKKKDRVAAKKTTSTKPNKWIKIQTPRGMKDILPEAMLYYDLVLKTAQNVLNYYGYQKIETPVLEKAELFIRSVGKESDIAHKEMYFVKNSEEQLVLRPEGTAPVARLYIENALFNLSQPVKLYYFLPFFRHEKPQAGRYRQFYQLGAEALGSDSPALDAQIILITSEILIELGLGKDIVFKLNSIGCQKCRHNYIKHLTKYYKQYSNKLCNDCRRRLKLNPLRLLDCKDEHCVVFKEGAPNFLDYLCDDCRAHFKKLLEILDGLNISYNLDKTLVRGFDYYTKTVFEIMLGSDQTDLAVGGGGRYDGLIETIGRLSRPGVGMALGVERLIEQIKNKKRLTFPKSDIFLIQLGDQARLAAFKLLEECRKNKILVRESLGQESLKNQLRIANNYGVNYTIIIGQEEVINDVVILKDMNSGLQEIVPSKKIIEVLRGLNKSALAKPLNDDSSVFKE